LNIISQLEKLAHSLPCELKQITNLSRPIQEAISKGDGNAIKEFLSNSKMNADVTKVTAY
jgi:hypothetical protein